MATMPKAEVEIDFKGYTLTTRELLAAMMCAADASRPGDATTNTARAKWAVEQADVLIATLSGRVEE